jgi:hypothetical protein
MRASQKDEWFNREQRLPATIHRLISLCCIAASLAIRHRSPRDRRDAVPRPPTPGAATTPAERNVFFTTGSCAGLSGGRTIGDSLDTLLLMSLQFAIDHPNTVIVETSNFSEILSLVALKCFFLENCISLEFLHSQRRGASRQIHMQFPDLSHDSGQGIPRFLSL